jgi:hypothetical protein
MCIWWSREKVVREKKLVEKKNVRGKKLKKFEFTRGGLPPPGVEKPFFFLILICNIGLGTAPTTMRPEMTPDLERFDFLQHPSPSKLALS